MATFNSNLYVDIKKFYNAKEPCCLRRCDIAFVVVWVGFVVIITCTHIRRQLGECCITRRICFRVSCKHSNINRGKT